MLSALQQPALYTHYIVVISDENSLCFLSMFDVFVSLQHACTVTQYIFLRTRSVFLFCFGKADSLTLMLSYSSCDLSLCFHLVDGVDVRGVSVVLSVGLAP